MLSSANQIDKPTVSVGAMAGTVAGVGKRVKVNSFARFLQAISDIRFHGVISIGATTPIRLVETTRRTIRRRIKTQTVLPSAETAATLFWGLLASGQMTMRKVDGWQSLAEKPSDQIIDLAA